MSEGFTLFDTQIGPCGLVWRGSDIAGVQLPENTSAQTRARIIERFPGLDQSAPRGAAKRARDAVMALLDGRARDLRNIALDTRGITPFRQRVYAVARAIAPGETLSYGELAKRLDKPGASRAVGQALGANPFPIIVPCHRVLTAGDKAGGFSAAGGVTTKGYLLRIEGTANTAFNGFEYDPLIAFYHLRAADSKLARIIAQVGPPKIALAHTATVFDALARAIVYQQLSGKAAATIFGRVCDLFPRGGGGLNANNVLAAKPSTLRGAGLSNNKMLALRDLAERSLAGEVPALGTLNSMEDEAIVETLTKVRGIGRWTVEMLLIFRLGRGDVMAVDDLGLRQGHAVIMGRKGETKRQALAAYAERWRPYRSVASWYLWRAVELDRQR